MKNTKKMCPADYPTFIFRVSKTDKATLVSAIGKALRIVRSNQNEDEKLHNKNDVIVEALKIGIKAIEKRKRLKG